MPAPETLLERMARQVLLRPKPAAKLPRSYLPPSTAKNSGQLSLCSSLLSRLFRTTAPPPQQRLETSRAREECSALLSGIRGAAVAEAQHVAAPRLARSPAELCPGRGEFDSFMVSAVFVTSTLIPSIETYLEPASCFRQTRNLL